jgi:hypothetical protein
MYPTVDVSLKQKWVSEAPYTRYSEQQLDITLEQPNHTELVGVAVTFHICILNVPNSNLDWITD